MEVVVVGRGEGGGKGVEEAGVEPQNGPQPSADEDGTVLILHTEHPYTQCLPLQDEQ